MKRALFVLFLFVATAAVAGERSEKQQLVAELLELIDAKAMTQASFENMITALSGAFGEDSRTAADIPEEYRAEWEKEQRKEEARRREFTDRMFARLDYEQYFDQAYVPLFENFTTAELRELIDFFRTRSGQKLAKALPRFGSPGAMRLFQEAADATQKELESEDAAKHPWKQTMADMRSLATAVEARATDVNEYPRVAFEELEPLIAPTYIRDVPKVDAWGTPFLYVGNGEHYRFVSAGADKRFEWSSRQLDPALVEERQSESLDADIIFQDGNFIQSPKAAYQR